MKRTILTLGLIAFLGLSAASCSTDDSALDTNKTTSADGFGFGDGTKDLPKPTPPRP